MTILNGCSIDYWSSRKEVPAMEHGREHCHRHSGSLSSVSCVLKTDVLLLVILLILKAGVTLSRRFACETEMMVLPDCFAANVLTHRRYAGSVWHIFNYADDCNDADIRLVQTSVDFLLKLCIIWVLILSPSATSKYWACFDSWSINLWIVC